MQQKKDEFKMKCYVMKFVQLFYLIIFLSLITGTSSASFTVYTNEDLWVDAVTAAGYNIVRFDTTTDNIAKSNEIFSPPAPESDLGVSLLTFEAVNTELPISFTYEGQDGSLSLQFIESDEASGLQSLGFGQDGSNDGWIMQIQNECKIHAFAFELLNNQHNPEDKYLVVYDNNTELGRVGYFGKSNTWSDGFFIGVLSDTPFDRVFLHDETLSIPYDNFGTQNFRFGGILNNKSPIADAGPDQAIIQIGSTVQLDGTQSWDPEGDTITYNWSIVSKPEESTAELSDPTSHSPTFQADIHGDYTIELVVSDGSSFSTPDQIIVSFDNAIPVSSVMLIKSVMQGEAACFDGGGSNDANGDPLSFTWTLTSRPVGSSAFIDELSSMEACITTDLAGNYEVTLIVNDGWVDSEPSTASVLVVSHLDATTMTLQEIIDAINVIDPVNLKNKNMQKALSNKVNAVLELVEHGAYFEALDKLQKDLLGKTDGCAETGTPDKNDWLRDCGGQDQLYPLITEAIGYLENM